MTLKVAFYDLDNTLYSHAAGLMEIINERISRFVQQRFQLDATAAMALRHDYFSRYGTTLGGLQRHHDDIDSEEYLRFVHDISIDSHIQADLALYQSLERLPLQKVVFTNSPAEWASRVLERLGIEGHFSHLLDIRAVEFQAKPSERAYQIALQTLGVSGAECVLIEDTSANLRPARTLGMTTVLISSTLTKHPDADWVFTDAISATRHIHALATSPAPLA